MYIAIKHIGNKYTPGETLPDNLPDDTLEWLKKAGAVREIAPAPVMPPRAKAPSNQDDNELTRENNKRQQINAPGYNADGTTKVEADEELEEGMPVDDSEEDEIDEEAEAPEIDIMDGLVSEQTEEPKPARTNARKASTSKPAKGGRTK